MLIGAVTFWQSQDIYCQVVSTYQLSANAYRHSIMDLFTNVKPGYLARDYTTAVGSTVVARLLM